MKTLKIAVLFSGGASALKYLLKNDPTCGKSYEFVCGISNKKDTSGEKLCHENRIPFKEFNTKKYALGLGYDGPLNAMPEEVRNTYFMNILSYLRSNYMIDFILLSGFMLRISEPLLGSYPIINVHPADLDIKDTVTGKPKYTGDDAVTMAFEAGELYTASTIHVVEREVDCGKIICISDPLYRVDEVSAKDHQEKMKTFCDGPAYQKALQMITSGSFSF